MSVERPWVRHELPWLRSGPLFRVHRNLEPELDALLGRFSYHRLDLDGSAMTSSLAAHAELARAFHFPDYYGKNWDAFNDSFGDFVAAHSGQLYAIVWHNLEVAAKAAPATTVEVGWALLGSAFAYMPKLGSGDEKHIDLDVFALGDGDDFDRP